MSTVSSPLASAREHIPYTSRGRSGLGGESGKHRGHVDPSVLIDLEAVVRDAIGHRSGASER
ncbi:hypothetical protein [Kitasatospora sp. GP82]|uniref:hypothetical protein n=1 Tax=Kitasatospora sp. GP82 TaxID=3035089 RepID=UPI002473FE86|nr:hypothetical protein [Kitasatospora sp. GP82]MDH6129033.1 hypothetical protein [Kitasatospora sp. GP82]